MLDLLLCISRLIVLRILKSYLENTKLETLGFSSQSVKMLNEIMARKYG